MTALRLHYRAPRYLDRTLALETGEVSPLGIDLDYESSPSLGGSFEAVQAGRIDAAEVLLSDVFTAIASGDDRLVALPLFPSRRFAQRFIFVAHGSELQDLASLDGRRLGWPTGAATAAIWVRALATSAAALPDLEPGPIGGSLSRILDRDPLPGEPLAARVAAGELDGLVTPYPVPGDEHGAGLRLLFRDPGAHERAHIRGGGFLPISNVVVVRRELYERHRWIACSLVDAFAEAQALGSRRLNYLGALAVSLPWLSVMLEEVDELFAGQAFPYGVEPNRAALDAFAAHGAALGVAAREVAIDELFAPEVLDHPGIPEATSYDVPMRGTR